MNVKHLGGLALGSLIIASAHVCSAQEAVPTATEQRFDVCETIAGESVGHCSRDSMAHALETARLSQAELSELISTRATFLNGGGSSRERDDVIRKLDAKIGAARAVVALLQSRHFMCWTWHTLPASGACQPRADTSGKEPNDTARGW